MIKKITIYKFLSFFLLFIFLIEAIPLKAQAGFVDSGSSVFGTIFSASHNYNYYNRPYAFDSQIISDLSEYTNIFYLDKNNVSYPQSPIAPSESLPDTSSITEINFIGTPSEVRAFSKDDLSKARRQKKNIEARKSQGKNIYLSQEDKDFLEDFDNLNFPEPDSENTVIVTAYLPNYTIGKSQYYVKQTYAVLDYPLSSAEAKTITRVKYKDSQNVDISVATDYQQEDYVWVYERPGLVTKIYEGEKKIYEAENVAAFVPMKQEGSFFGKKATYGYSQLEKDEKTYYIAWIDDWAWGNPDWLKKYTPCHYAYHDYPDQNQEFLQKFFCNYGSYASSPWLKKISVVDIQTTSEPVTLALNSNIIYLREPRCVSGCNTSLFSTKCTVRCDTEALSADGRVGQAVYEDSKKSWGGMFLFYLPAVLFMVQAYYLAPYLAAINEPIQGTLATVAETFTTSGIDILPMATTEIVVQGVGGVIAGYVTTVGASPVAIGSLAASALAKAVFLTLSDPIVQMVSTPGGFGTVEDSDKLGVGYWTWWGGFKIPEQPTFSLPTLPPTSTYVINPPSASKPVGQTQQFIGWYDPDGPSGSQANQDKTNLASWSSSNTSVATISSGLAACSAAGSVTITSVYSGITATANLSCSQPGPECNFLANPTTIILPQSSTLSWSCQYVDSCSIDQGIGSVNNVSGTKRVRPTKTTTYTLTCSSIDASRSWPATVNVGFIPRLREVIPH